MLAQMLRRHAKQGLTFVTSATSANSATIVIPSSAAVGDLAILYDGAFTTSAYPSAVIPSGWTNTHNKTLYGSPFYVRSTMCLKVLVSGDPGSTITGMASINTFDQKTILIFRPNKAIKTVTTYEVSDISTESNAAAQTKAVQTEPYVVIGGCLQYTSAAWAGVWYDASIGSNRQLLAYKVFNASGAEVTMDINDAGAINFLQSCALVVT